MSVVRTSKFRHVFASEAKKENSYEGFRPTNCAFDGSFIAANAKLLAFCVETGGSGTFCVIPISKVGRLEVDLPKASAHKEYVLDLKWNPYNDSMLASCSEDGSIKIWEFSEHGLLTNIDSDKALLTLEYHERRCVQINWHPIASNVLLSVSQEPKICIWNLDEGVAEVELDVGSIVFSAEWSQKGDKIVTSCKDKTFKIYDARSGDMLMSGNGHKGSKAMRVCFTFNDTMLFSTGFSKMSERQFGIWKINDNKIEEKLITDLDTTNGLLVPFYDPDTQIVYLVGKGDTAIRYYEITEDDPYFYFITTFNSKDPQRSVANIPKRSVDVNGCIIFQFYKMISTSKGGFIKPVSFKVPRKSDLFQEDLYPDAISDESAIEAGEWFEGKDVEPNRVAMSTFFKGKQRQTGSSGGGLKKGGLKGLKARKEAKEVAKVEPTASKTTVKSPSPEPTKAPTRTSSPPAVSTAPATTSSKSDGAVALLQDEVKSLKANEKKMQKEIKALTDKIEGFDKLTADIKLLCDAVKKNDNRLNTLEALVQEESDNEAEE